MIFLAPIGLARIFGERVFVLAVALDFCIFLPGLGRNGPWIGSPPSEAALPMDRCFYF